MKTLIVSLIVCCLTAFSLPSFSEEKKDEDGYILTVIIASYLSNGGVESRLRFQETRNEASCTRLAQSVVSAFKKVHKRNYIEQGEIETSCDPK